MNLPEWLIGDAEDERTFVIHLHWPRFVMEMHDDGSGEVVMSIDPGAEVIQQELKAGREPAVLMARLMREAGEFFHNEIDREL